MYKIMTAGPTQIRQNVLWAGAEDATNPDLDMEFFQFYKDFTSRLNHYVNGDGQCYILGGEGILGLEAAIASLTEKDDEVLILDNGIFGKGFGDFVSMYQGKPHYYTSNYHKALDAAALDKFLKEWYQSGNRHFKYATLVHCDTPSGILNPIDKLCPVLKKYGILTVVDAVSSLFACDVDMQVGIDILCGGSQKAISAPPGLTMVWLSKEALNTIDKRKSEIPSFYANLALFKDYYEKKWFPYTMPIHQIKGLYQAFLNVVNEPQFIERHERIASATRKSCLMAGLNLWGENGYSPTVTAISVPNGTSDIEILSIMKNNHNIMLSGAFDALSGKIIRIGHMGENANVGDVYETLAALDKTFLQLNIPTKQSLAQGFIEALEQ